MSDNRLVDVLTRPLLTGVLALMPVGLTVAIVAWLAAFLARLFGPSSTFGALLKHWGQLGPAEIPPKRRFVYRFFQWNADRLGVPFEMPPRHPYNPLPSLRLCVAAGAEIDHARAIFDVIYGQGVQPDAPEGIDAMARALGLPDPEAAMSASQVKDTLRANTERAIADGVFGVPTFVVDGEVFWGGDATDMMLSYLEDQALFQTPEMKRISEIR